MHTRQESTARGPRTIPQEALDDIRQLLVLRETLQYYEVMNVLGKKHKLTRKEIEAAIEKMDVEADEGTRQ